MLRRACLGAALVGLLASGCASDWVPTEPAPATSTPPASTGIGVWALGDSQGSLSNDPARGLPWTVRLGGDVGNGADRMQGAGWTVPGTISNLTITQKATEIARTNTVRQYIVMAGVNDLKVPRTAAEMMAGVETFAAHASSIGAKVLYVGIVPLPQAATITNREATRRAFNEALRARFGTRYLDCSPAMSTSAGWLKPEYSLSPVDLHLNSAGEQALATCINAVR